MKSKNKAKNHSISATRPESITKSIDQTLSFINEDIKKEQNRILTIQKAKTKYHTSRKRQVSDYKLSNYPELYNITP